MLIVVHQIAVWGLCGSLLLLCHIHVCKYSVVSRHICSFFRWYTNTNTLWSLTALMLSTTNNKLSKLYTGANDHSYEITSILVKRNQTNSWLIAQKRNQASNEWHGETGEDYCGSAEMSYHHVAQKTKGVWAVEWGGEGTLRIGEGRGWHIEHSGFELKEKSKGPESLGRGRWKEQENRKKMDVKSEADDTWIRDFLPFTKWL